MNAPVQKITLSSARDVPFNKLVLSQSNVRKVKAGVSIEELAESIARRDLIQSLHVRPLLDADGKETGTYEVPAGGRRYRALEVLVKQKRLSKTAPIPCVVSDANSAILIDEVSLAENIERAPLHPLDQFRAFQAMSDKGMTEEAIAAAFFCNVKLVKQRLRLASVSPVLLDAYAEDAMTLEMLMAFTVSNSHERQEQVWASLQRQTWEKEPYHIRRKLTETSVPASDKRARFIGLDAYEAAGGTITRDLFTPAEEGFLEDPSLLDQLVQDKLAEQAQTVADEGWKWVDINVTLPYGFAHGLRELKGDPFDLTQDEIAKMNALKSEMDQLETDFADHEEYPDEVDQRLGEIEAELEAFENRPERFQPEDIAIAGVFISLTNTGDVLIDRGYVRPDDEPPVSDAQPNDDGSDGDGDGGDPVAGAGERGTTVTANGQPIPDPETEDEDDGLKPLPERLVAELTAHRTLALQNTVAEHPHVAMTMLLHKLVSDHFHRTAPTGCLEARVHHVSFPAQSDDLKESGPALQIAERQEHWSDHIPADDQGLWDWLTLLDPGTRLDLLAHCVSFGVNALFERPNPYSGSGVSQHGLDVRLSQADRLARATGLDMVTAGWKPTVGNYLGRVTKSHIVEAVREGAGDRAAMLISHLKKGDMAQEAERLLADTGWLPEPLRLVDSDDGQAIDTSVEADGDDLPAFLSDDDEATDGGGDDEAEAKDDGVHPEAAE